MGCVKKYEGRRLSFITTLLGLIFYSLFGHGEPCLRLQRELVMPATGGRYDVSYTDVRL